MDHGSNKAIDRFFNSGLKLNQLRIVVALAELKQIKLVAQAFHVTQPAISKQIADMEQALGVDLIKRAGQRIEFTAYGHVLALRAREIIYQVSNARKDFASLLSGTTGNLSMGVATTVTPVLVPEALAAFHQRASNVAISLVEGTADRLWPLLEDRSMDIVVARAPAPPGNKHLHDITIANDPLVLVVSRQHPLAFRMAPAWKDLEGNQWVLPSPSSPVYHALVTLLKKYDISLPQGGIHSTSLLANARLISRTSLIGLLPKTLAHKYAAEGSLAVVPLDVSSILERVHVIWHNDNDNPTVPLMTECLEYCGNVYADLGA